MDNPEEENIRRSIRNFIQINSNVDAGKITLLFKYRQNKSAKNLVSKGNTQNEIDYRIERSNRIFNEELGNLLPTRSSTDTSPMTVTYIQPVFKLPSPMSISPTKTKETSFQATGRFNEAQLAYLASRHKDYCTIFEHDLSELGRNKYTIRVNLIDNPYVIANRIPPVIKMLDGTRLKLEKFNIMLDWLCSTLSTVIQSGRLSRITIIDPDFAIMTYIAHSILQAIAARPILPKDISLLAIASLIYYYRLNDLEYISYIVDGNLKVEDIKNELAWFTKFATTGPKRFVYNYSDYNVYASHFIISPTFKQNLQKCILASRIILIELNITFFTRTQGQLDIPKQVGAHANMLLYDSRKNIIERFDPEVGKGETTYLIGTQYVDDLIGLYFKKDFDIEYLSPLEWCPINIQTEQEIELEKGNVSGKISGFCQAWSFWYADVRLSNPDLNREQVIELAFIELKKRPQTLTEYIISYTKNFEKFL